MHYVAAVTAVPVVSRAVPRGNAKGITPSPKKRVNLHMTGRKDTLGTIAAKYGTDWQTLANANRSRLTVYRDPSNPVPPGINLVIP